MDASKGTGKVVATGMPVVSRGERAGRVVLLAMGLAGLVTGIYGGLLRLPVRLPVAAVEVNWLVWHGPLMVCGFLGTLIGIERAVGLQRWWPWMGPLLTAASAAALMTGRLGPWAQWGMVAGSVWFVWVSVRIHRIQPVLSNAVMAAGAVAWSVGNVRWAAGGNVPGVVLWWVAFLLLTITGERIQLTRFRKPSKWSRPLLHAAFLVLGLGLLASFGQGTALARAAGIGAGAGIGGLALWLWRYDIARLTIRHTGLPRFMAACLLGGYGWLVVTAVLLVCWWPQAAGLRYDAILHAFFVGFVFSMIYGHAPVIFPAVLGLPVRFTKLSYVPAVVMHLSLGLRVAGDLTGWMPGRAWGGVGNAAATGLFLLLTAGSVIRAVKGRTS